MIFARIHFPLFLLLKERLFSVLAFILITAISLSTRAETIQLYTENFKPYQFMDEAGEIKGLGVELVTAMFDKAGLQTSDKIRMGVWTNVYDLAKTNKNSAVFMTVRNTEREPIFHWVGPLANREMWLYRLTERNDISANNLEDAKKYRVGAYKSAQSDYLEELGFSNLDIVLKEELNIKKLLAGRIDLMPSSAILMQAKLQDLNLPTNAVKKVILFDKRFDYYLAINKETNPETVTRLQKALNQLKQDGHYDQLSKKYTGE